MMDPLPIYKKGNKWILDEIFINAGQSVTVVAPAGRNVILYFPDGITSETQYIISGGESADIYTNKKPPDKNVESGQTVCYTFAGIIDFENCEGEDEADYIHSNSVCKIKIKY